MRKINLFGMKVDPVFMAVGAFCIWWLFFSGDPVFISHEETSHEETPEAKQPETEKTTTTTHNLNGYNLTTTYAIDIKSETGVFDTGDLLS